eukprot:750854-Hanusia_phi.AAC.1
MEERKRKIQRHTVKCPLRVPLKSCTSDLGLVTLIENSSLVQLIVPSERIVSFLQVSRGLRKVFLGYLQGDRIPFEIHLGLTSNKSRFNSTAIDLTLFRASRLYIHVSKYFQCQPLLRAIAEMPEGSFNSENRIIIAQKLSQVHVSKDEYLKISNALLLEGNRSDISNRYCLDMLNQFILLNPSFRRMYCACGGLDQILHFVHHMYYNPRVRELFIQNIALVLKNQRISEVSTLPWLSVAFYLTRLLQMHEDSALVAKSLELVCEILENQALRIQEFREMISEMTIYCMHQFADDFQVQRYSFKLIEILVLNHSLFGVVDVSKSLRSDKALTILIDSLLSAQIDDVTLRHAFDAMWSLVMDDRFVQKLVSSGSLQRARNVLATPCRELAVEDARSRLFQTVGHLLA